MDSFFGTNWDALTLDAVERFLRDEAEAEGLTWEAKGADPRGRGDRPHRDSLRKHVSAFANSERGGFYILGAAREERNAGPWNLDPLDFEGEEPTTWASRLIRTGVRPVPPYDVREWELDGRHVAVIRIDPVSEPPCITGSGEVFIRVSGESVPVKDPETLRRLSDAGSGRRLGAEAEALANATAVSRIAGAGRSQMNVVLGVASTGRSEDITSALFSQRFHDLIQDQYLRLPPAALYPYPPIHGVQLHVERSELRASSPARSNPQAWEIRARWNGSVAIDLDVTPEQDDAARLSAEDVFARVVRPAAATALTLLASLGGYGSTHVVLNVYGRFELSHMHERFGRIPGYGSKSVIRTWTGDDGRITDEQFDRMRRELLRLCGVLVLEP